MNPVKKYHKRYLSAKKSLGISSDTDSLLKLIDSNPSGLNNYFMAAMGMSTLMLRLGAVIQMCQKLEQLDVDGDALFMKQILDNLRETLPSDTSWKNLWLASAEQEEWTKPVTRSKKEDPLLNRFITFRNRFVHQQIQLREEHLQKLIKGVAIFDAMADLYALFESGILSQEKDKFYWEQNKKKVCLHPYIQSNKNGGDAFIFQGLYKNKTAAHLLNMSLGNEIEQNSSTHLEPNFMPLKNSIKGGAGQVFDHGERLAYYQSCFVGRDMERDAIIDFCTAKDEKNILCVKSAAGMGKGALIADTIDKLQEQKVQTLYHFCGAGIQNSLHATLYHFIIQGNKQQYWDKTEDEIKRKLQRLPSKYIDVIHLFQNLLENHLKILKNNNSENLVVIIDGLDEAQVAYAQLHISDWFSTYNEKEEPEEDWRSSSHIRWVFTYRCDADGTESFYRFPKMNELNENELLQPMKGLSEGAVEEAFKDFSVSKEFKEAVIDKARIV